MRIMCVEWLRIAVVIVGIALAGTVHADTLVYTVGGWSQQFPGPVTPPINAPWSPDGYPGDTVELDAYTDSFELAPDTTTYIKKINTLLWTLDYTYAGTATDPAAWSNLQFAFSAQRQVTLRLDEGTTSGYLSQAGFLEVTWYYDELSLAQGSTRLFIGGYQIDITPFELSPVQGDALGVQPDRDVMARFDVSLAPSVPTPSSFAALLGMGAVGLVGVARRRWKKA